LHKRNFFEFLEKDLQIGIDNQKLVATEDGGNAANFSVLGNDSEKDMTRKGIVEGVVGNRLDSSIILL
jgi:hypothetical protein